MIKRDVYHRHSQLNRSLHNRRPIVSDAFVSSRCKNKKPSYPRTGRCSQLQIHLCDMFSANVSKHAIVRTSVYPLWKG
jgi:hypothetical protein